MIVNNFGFNGLPPAEWEDFLCLTKKCKRRREEQQELKNEKKTLKNDERRAEIERLRAETEVLSQVTNCSGPRVISPPNPLPGPGMMSTSIPPNVPEPTSGTSPWLYAGIGLGALLLIGGAIVIIRRRKA